MKTVLLFFVFFLIFIRLNAQEVQLNEPAEIARLTRVWTNSNRANPRVDGWRVQLMSSTDRQQVETARNRFRSLFPDIPAEWIHEKPYYKLRVGAFRSRLDALSFINTRLEDIYSGAYPARDANIHPRNFLTN